jgi:aubergine-like protein
MKCRLQRFNELLVLFMFTEALYKYRKHNQNRLPQRIVIYRDGVGEGQIPYVYEHEVDKIKV